MRAGLATLLAAESTISDFVGSRVYVSSVPQGVTSSHIVISKSSQEGFECLDGSTGEIVYSMFDVDCVAQRSVTCESMSAAVREYLDDMSNQATGVSGEVIATVNYLGEDEDLRPPTDGSQISLYSITLSFGIFWRP